MNYDQRIIYNEIIRLVVLNENSNIYFIDILEDTKGALYIKKIF